jgi:hypothetical protein
MKDISVTCKTKDTLKLEEITRFQEDLKSRDEADLKKIKKSLIKYGISFPFFIWKDGNIYFCLDGHGRRVGLMELQVEGYTVPPVPVVFIYAENKEDAKQRILRLNSRYGMITRDSVLQFVGDIEIDYDDLAIPESANIFFDAVVKDIDNYFNKIPEGDEKRKKTIKTCPHCGRILP